MDVPKYELKAEDSLRVFEFYSVDPKGRILKLVEFTELSSPGIYNLAFGDKNLETGGIDDLAISDNGDREKILATVVSAIHNFTEFHEEATVYAIGSTNSRTRLYQMGIARYLGEATTEFYIFGLNDGYWEEFNKETNYAAFLVKSKVAQIRVPKKVNYEHYKRVRKEEEWKCGDRQLSKKVLG